MGPLITSSVGGVLVGEFTRDGLVKRHCGWAALDVWPGLGGQMREARLSLAKVGWQMSSSAGRNQGRKTAFTEPGSGRITCKMLWSQRDAAIAKTEAPKMG